MLTGPVTMLPPRVPAVTEMTEALPLRAVDADRLWVNPDCGLKPRGYAEAALRSLVMAARQARVTVAR
jgi:5-methyltetrahydropteroyltriglutamate--homocysteine methyltransferase